MACTLAPDHVGCQPPQHTLHPGSPAYPAPWLPSTPCTLVPTHTLTALAFPPTCMQRSWNQDQLESSSVDLPGEKIPERHISFPRHQECILKDCQSVLTGTHTPACLSGPVEAHSRWPLTLPQVKVPTVPMTSSPLPGPSGGCAKPAALQLLRMPWILWEHIPTLLPSLEGSEQNLAT